jgi:hypothetical protein
MVLNLTKPVYHGFLNIATSKPVLTPTYCWWLNNSMQITDGKGTAKLLDAEEWENNDIYSDTSEDLARFLHCDENI